MPSFPAEKLREIGYQIFEAVGCTSEHARIIADHLVDSSLAGHDSHGVMRFYEYVDDIAAGRFDPRGVPHVVWEKPCTALVDGGGAMGQVGAKLATDIAIRKARDYGTATVTLRNTSHIGRVGTYPLMVARAGLIGLMFCNAGRLGRQIAPHGGLDGKLSTNPIAFAAPRRDADPILVDMATSATAEGKLRVARNRGAAVPAGWLIDREGRPTTDTEDYLSRGGAMLPLGGVAGHKGMCLSFIVELLGGALSGEGVANGATTMTSNGVLLTVLQIEHFTDLEAFYDEVETLARHVLSSRVDPTIGEIQLPGEFEFRNTDERSRNGIEVDDTTWQRICAAGEKLGVDTASWRAA